MVSINLFTACYPINKEGNRPLNFKITGMNPKQ